MSREIDFQHVQHFSFQRLRPYLKFILDKKKILLENNKELSYEENIERIFQKLSYKEKQKLFDLYMKNIEECKNLYSYFHIFEVFLRNKIVDLIALQYKDKQWLINYKTHSFLLEKDKNKIHEAYEYLYFEKKKEYDRRLKQFEKYKRQLNQNDIPKIGVITQEHIISKLSLDFWCGLFYGEYEQKLWIHNNIIEKLFPHTKNNQRNLKTIRYNIHQIKLLRNRVFHHETIILERFIKKAKPISSNSLKNKKENSVKNDFCKRSKNYRFLAQDVKEIILEYLPVEMHIFL